MGEINRREFLLQAGVLAAAGSALGAASTPEVWYGKPMRWAQLTLVEDDPGNYDLNLWLDYFRRTHSDAACLSAGGCVSPTTTPKYPSITAAKSSATATRSATSWPAAASSAWWW